MGREEGQGRERQDQREAEIVDTVRKLNFLENQGVDVQVGLNGEVDGFIPGANPVEGDADWDKVGIVYENLHQMHKSERERSIILEAWERFRDEEG